MEAMFIRHNLNQTNEFYEDFWSKGLIAVHFDNIESVDPNDYKQSAGRKALKKLWKFCDDGAIVGAEYPVRAASLLVGLIEPKSRVEV